MSMLCNEFLTTSSVSCVTSSSPAVLCNELLTCYLLAVTRKQLSVNAGEVLEPALCVQDAQTHDAHATSHYFSAVTCIKGTDSMTESMMTLEPLLDDPKDPQLKWGGRVR